MSRRLNIKGPEGFGSIVEIVVTSIIFVVAAAGIMSTVSMPKPQTRESSKKVEAAYIGKGIIDEIRQEVSAAEGGVFFGSKLNVGTHSVGTTEGYTVNYTVTEPIQNVRKIDMTITWPD